MARKVIGLIFLLVFLHTILFSEASLPGVPPKKKSVAVGILLGALGLTGILVPGTYGWGNFYAGDRSGFLILNIGGSAFTLLEYYSVGISPSSEDIPPLFTVGLVGSLGFATASVIWGALSVVSHNSRIVEQSRLSFAFFPSKDGLHTMFQYEY